MSPYPEPLRAAARPHLLALAALLTTSPALIGAAHAASATAAAQATAYSIPAGPLSRTVSQFAAQAGVQLSADAALTANINSRSLQGRYTVAQGFTALLAGNGLVAVQQGDGEYTLQKAGGGQGVQGNAEGEMLPEVKVTARARQRRHR